MNDAKIANLLSFKVWAFLLALFCLVACIEPFEDNFVTDLRLVVVEGTLTNLVDESFVNLREAIPSGSNTSVFRPIVNAKVSVLENETTRIEYTETENGIYKPPSGFLGKIGSSYTLEFTREDGNTYKSKAEVLTAVPAIERVYQTTDERGPVVNGNTVPGNTIYIDTKDPVGLGNNYLWSWTLYEREYACKTCEGGRFFTDPFPEGRCVGDEQLRRRNTIYDYICERPCWKIFKSNDVNAQSDAFSDGLTIQNREITQVPYFNDKGGLIEVKQQSISTEAFAYLRLLIQQGQNTGGLADTPPAALEGNVSSLNKSEVVSGYFLVSGMTKQRYWIDRSDMLERGFRPLGLLGGREIRQEPPPDGPTDRPPFAQCIASPTRTTKRPAGFLFE